MSLVFKGIGVLSLTLGMVKRPTQAMMARVIALNQPPR